MLLSISANSRILMTGATEIRGWMAETSGVHVSGATSLWLQTTVSVTLGESRRPDGEPLTPLPRRAKIDMHEP